MYILYQIVKELTKLILKAKKWKNSEISTMIQLKFKMAKGCEPTLKIKTTDRH